MKKIWQNSKIFIFSLNFRQFLLRLDDDKTLGNAENWALETLWKATQINPLATQIQRYVIPNTKNWLKFENFHFFNWNFTFLRYVLCRNTKNCKTLSLKKRQEAAEIITLDAYFYLTWKRKKIDQKLKIFSFSLIFDILLRHG